MSRARAIDQHCKDCIYDPAEPGNWRQQTEACEITSCPLWPYRPKSSRPLNPSPAPTGESDQES